MFVACPLHATLPGDAVRDKCKRCLKLQLKKKNTKTVYALCKNFNEVQQAKQQQQQQQHTQY